MALQLSTRGVLALVDHAVPGQLRAAWIRLLAIDPGVQLVVTAKALFDLPEGALVLYAPDPAADGVTLNMMRPIVADRRYRIVLWCEDGIAAELLRYAPDFFDWITAHVACPWAPMPHALATIMAAYRARAPAIGWNGPGLEETLGWLRPHRPLVRVSADDYGALVEAMRTRAPSWLCVDNVVDEYDAQRVAWACIEARRRIPVFTHAAWGVSKLGQPWFEIHGLRPTAPVPETLWLALKSEPTAVQVARRLPVPIPDAALEHELMAEEDAGPLYARSIGDAFPSRRGWPLWILRRESLPLSTDSQHLYDVRCVAWPSADWETRAQVALDAGQREIAARWLAHSNVASAWLRAQLAWDDGALPEVLTLLGDAESDGPPETTLRQAIREELELTPRPFQALDRAGWKSTYVELSRVLREATSARGRFHRRAIELHRELAVASLHLRELDQASDDVRAGRQLARRIFPARHPEIAKIDFCYAIARALEGGLSEAAEITARIAQPIDAAYPPAHSSHRALARLRAEIDMRRGYAATAQPAPLDEQPTWWLRPAFSLSYVPPAP